ncbi:flagellar hook-associated protein FlgK [Caballeronia sp. LP006]|uniref:flagellar hook-associated protein FlgK n=1 Tax=unclassified Caballeronia TaxID=2646786 RepID=UPI001FD18A3F|nr:MULTISPECIES: flagellar hook-associated protein FlgK [unclassified Caballeronia]MDR5772868.1 flagellar hook-associated protein FlgK [Caballeronia sp. LZ002]MDR5803674.1 flagellar hook-associated protein FlgK [Caballeronia sp. LZ001]MDR5829758.1 flagellar hook-associated protein FlgK [Caballeronia sp. LP006]MDR5848302.1 flagellar hook-associated protein FlgK [Caballeronia sp. LZ003]
MSNNIFNIGLSGLNAAQWGLTVTGQNISNAATPGYTLEKASFQESSGQYTGSGYLGSGVQTTTVTRQYSQYLTTQVNNTTASSSAANTYYSLISQLNNLVGDPTTGIATGISNYFSGMQSVANSASSTSSRQSLMSNAQTLANQLNSAGEQYDQLRSSVNTQLTSAVSSINSYTQQIADLNKQINVASAQGQQPNQLMDQRDQAVASLSSMVGVQVVQTDGNYNIFVGNGQPLVVGGTASALQTVTSPTDPSELTVAFKSKDGTTPTAAQTQYLDTSALSGGVVGGLMDFRSQTLDPAQAQLGAIATSFAAQLNGQNSLGLDLNGQAGGALFSAGSPTVYADARNKGTGTVTAEFSDATQPTSSDLTVTYNGTGFDVTDTQSGKALGSFTPPNAFDGLKITPSGTMQAGDSFSIQPTRASLDNFQLATTNGSAIAAASPAVTSAATANTGTATISSATVAAGYSTPSAIALTYNSTAGGFTSNVAVTVGTTNYPANTTIPYDSSKGLTVTSNGISATISGKPANTDVFNINPNTGGTSDGSNALTMSNLVSTKSMNGTDTLTNSYANYVNQIGNQTNQLKSTSSSQTALLSQATSAQQSVQGVNLNEEAANLMQYQQLYQANSKVIQTASTLFQTLLGIFN